MKKPFLFSAAALLLLTGAAAPESPEYTVSKHHNGPELYYYYADTAGNRLNDVRYAEAHPFCGDRALVRETKKYGYIGPAGELAIPYRFDAALNFGDLGFDKDLAVVRFAFRDELREFITPWTYGDSEMVLINRRGEAVTPRYEVIRPVAYGLAVVVETRRNHGLPVEIAEPNEVPDACKWGCIDKCGREVIPCIYDRIFGDRRIAVAGAEGGQVGRRGQPGAGGHSVHPRFLPLQERARAGFQLRPGRRVARREPGYARKGADRHVCRREKERFRRARPETEIAFVLRFVSEISPHARRRKNDGIRHNRQKIGIIRH